MEITQYTRGLTVKKVHVKGAEESTNEEILNLAMERAGESRSSLFGTNIRWVDNFDGPETYEVAVVSLHTD